MEPEYQVPERPLSPLEVRHPDAADMRGVDADSWNDEHWEDWHGEGEER